MPAIWTKTCTCGRAISHFGSGDIECQYCGQPFNAFGQRLRRDWANNPSASDDSFGDMEGWAQEQYA